MIMTEFVSYNLQFTFNLFVNYDIWPIPTTYLSARKSTIHGQMIILRGRSPPPPRWIFFTLQFLNNQIPSG